MFPANDYSNETIHVANWVMLSGHIDVGKFVSEARQDAEKNVRAEWDKEKRAQADRAPAEIEERCQEMLAQELGTALIMDVGDAIGYSDGTELEYERYAEDRNFRDAELSVLLAPMVADAFRNISFESVSKLILSKMPAVAA